MPSFTSESIPPLGEISQSSSDSSNEGTAIPKLYKAPKLVHTKEWETMITDIASPFKPSGPDPPRSSYAGFDNESQVSQTRSSLSWKSSVSHDTTASISSDSTSDVAPLSPPQRSSVKNLVSMFSLFEGFQPASNKEKSPPSVSPSLVASSVVSGDSTLDSREESKWEKKAASLERECSTLQGIVCADSVHMTKMKREASELKKSNDQYIAEILHLSSILKSSANKLISLEVTKEDHEQLDTARSETIRLLKEEIESITDAFEEKETGYLERIRILNEEVERTKQEGEDRDFARRETISALREEIEILSESQTVKNVAEIEFEHELFARQILRDEQALQESKEILERKDKVIAQLTQQVEDEHSGMVALSLMQDKTDALEQEKKSLKSEFEHQLRLKDKELRETKEALDEIRRANEDEKSLSAAHVTELHLAETEQDLETALQLLKQQEEQMWHLEERIFQLTPEGASR